ncbi:DNA-binding response regulator, NarL/FixJ family, contains REC and HTH domains [Chitinophaga eiseniae]|uniref:DNA-binding response regulator, NarL/FixJ family, contains REC and HTH domains n=1 Tax=Chitinophaga eiseniae TaxID=634771 RepID=A0A1T4SX27_9BACT|nr:response regulator transcription factor [Chitinophaga eiseniae]SKA32805.1 DNA-binding response regulator, NarL/FixJ family, contains REC and HTH domains [Chitinophaga eiseniae]
MTPINIIIVDDHPIVLSGLLKMLEGHSRVRLLATYRDAASLLAGMGSHQPDVLLVDVQMPVMDGEALVKILTKQYPDVKLLVFSNFDQSYTVHRMFAAGAKGYLLKGADKMTIIEAVETVHAGKNYLDATMREESLGELLGASRQAITLTLREQEVLDLLAKDFTTKEIARTLFLSERTIDNHRSNLLLKLGARSVAGLVRKSMQMGLIN